VEGKSLEWSSRPPYGQRARASIRVRWTLGYKMGRPSTLITGSISRTTDLLAVPSRDLVACLALQVLQILRNPDKVFWSLPRSSGLWIRSSGPLAGR
jgi:hypothetical protein